jgi:hypothetical protein
MTLDDLKHIFRFQTTATDTYVPNGKLEYMLFEGNSRIAGSVAVEEIESLIVLLDNFQFDGYRDKTPLFIKPEVIIPL